MEILKSRPLHVNYFSCGSKPSLTLISWDFFLMVQNGNLIAKGYRQLILSKNGISVNAIYSREGQETDCKHFKVVPEGCHRSLQLEPDILPL